MSNLVTGVKVPDIVMESYIAAPIEKVFEHISTAAGWDAWFTKGTTVDLKKGGKIHLKFVRCGANNDELDVECPIIDVAAPNKLVFQWKSGDTPTTVKFNLESLDNGTLVEVVETGYKNTEKDLYWMMQCSTGWGEALTLLKFYLEHNVVYGAVPNRD